MAALLLGCGGATAERADTDPGAAPPAPRTRSTEEAHEGRHGQHEHGEHGHRGEHEHGEHEHREEHAQHGHPGSHGRDPHRGGDHHDFGDAEAFAAIFDAPDRHEWQHPEEVVELLDVRPGMTVADLGAGTGYFLPYLARAVGPEGRVIALDVEPAMVEHMCERVDEAGLENVDVRRVPPDDPDLTDGRIDRVVTVDTWHHIAHREAYAARLREALAPGGAVLVVDFTRQSPRGPPAQMRLTAEEVASELRAGGLAPQILEEELPYQYAVRGEAPAGEGEAAAPAGPPPRRSDCPR